MSRGAIAQLGERLHGMQEVVGSIPSSSTINLSGCKLDKKLYRPDIDGLRAIAVFSVILYHLGLSDFKGGFVGVDVFFVISGFLITRIIQKQIIAGTFSFREFYMRRVRRIMPALVFTMIFTLIAAAVFFSPQALHNTAKGTVSSLLSASNFFFWQENDYFNLNTQIQPLLHTWSLSIEEQFYLIWPAFLVLTFTRYSRRTVYILTTALIVVSLCLAQWVLKIDASAAFYLMPFRIAEFGVGAAVVWLSSYRVRPLIAEILCTVGMVLIFYAVFHFKSKMPFPGLTALVPCVGAALILYSGTARYSGWVLRNEGIRQIGLISYSLYLVHWPLIVFTRYQNLGPLTHPQMIYIVIASFLFAIFMYRFIEQPFRKYTFKTMPRPYYYLAIVTVIFVLIASVSMWNGWYWRLGEKAADLQKIGSASDYHIKFNGGVGCGALNCTTNESRLRKPMIYIFGDSHAEVYYAGFKAAFPDYDVRIFASSGCQLFSPEFDGPKPPNYRTQCDETRKQAFEAMSRNDGIVIITQMWGIGRMGVESLRTGEKISFASEDEYARFVATELRHLKKQTGNQKIIILGEVPPFGQYSSPLDCISRPYFTPRQCLANESTPGTRTINKSMNVNITDTIFIDPTMALCDDKSCHNFIDGIPAYSDDNHLSIKGSIFTVSKLEPSLRNSFKKLQSK